MDHLTQEDLALHAGVHCRTVRRWRDQGLIFEWSKYQEKAQLLVSRVEADRFLKARLSRTSRGFRHSEEVKRLSLLDPEQAKHIPRETLRRWKNQGKRRDRVREDRAQDLHGDGVSRRIVGTAMPVFLTTHGVVECSVIGSAGCSRPTQTMALWHLQGSLARRKRCINSSKAGGSPTR